jgi:hypothetical protein
VHLRLELGLLVRQQVDLHEGVGEAGRPICRRQVRGLENLGSML